MESKYDSPPPSNTKKQSEHHKYTPNHTFRKRKYGAPYAQYDDVLSDLIPSINGMIENKEYKTNKDMKNNRIKITENELKQIVAESVKKVLMESDDFKPHGYKGTSNYGGYEMQISDRGDEARLRDSHTGKVSDWLEIQFDEDGVAYVIDADGNEERLCDYMRY